MNVPLKQLLVHLDAGGKNVPRLQAARKIAQEHGAAITALYAVTPSYLDVPASDMSPVSTLALREADEQLKDRARKAFEVEMRSPGPAVAWADIAGVTIIANFVQQALYADVVVLGQRDPAQPMSVVPRDFNESVIVDSGKPALLIPYTGWSSAIGDNVVVAWKETRESARAVTAALPLLQRSRGVHVLSWAAETRPDLHGTRLDLQGFLRAHGVEAQWHDGGTEPEAIGEILLSRAFELDADLLVMGCYGHSRARELVLGGASRTVLRSMTLPVLMAH